MAQPQLMQIKLSRFDAQPWGFRLQGGVDFAAPLLVQKVNGGSLAENAGLLPGDAVLKINDVDVFNLRHKDAQDIVVRSGNNFVVTIQRGGSTWRPHVAPTGHLPQPQHNSPYLQTVTKTSLAHTQPQEVEHIGCGYNNAARPFVNGGDGSVKSIVNKQYNTPVGIYSDESIAETLSAQAEVLAGGVLGVNFKKNEKEYQGDRSEVLKFLREEESGHSTPAFNNHQYQEPPQQQQHQQQQHQQPQQHQHQHQPYQPQQHSTTRHVSAPINTPKPPSTGGLPVGQNICCDCERLITGVFVRIKDKNLHVECFKCATCGTSLKNQGYYNFNNKLYCDIHAKLAAMQHPPSGTEGYVPVPIKPNTKLSAGTISSALSAHGFNGVGFSNGSSTPTPAPAPAPVASNSTIPTEGNSSNNINDTDFNSINISKNNNNNKMISSSDEPSASDASAFEYVTLTGNVIRSVVAPGKGVNLNYKVNQGYARPFGAAPPAAAPKSPVSYPPQQQWGGAQQAKQAGSNAYATLPRSNVGQQEPDESLQPQYAEECVSEPPPGACYFEEDPELAEANRRGMGHFSWPPLNDDAHDTPTAAPLYIAPPETQHVVARPIQQPPPLPPDSKQTQAEESQQSHWQSHSAPQLTCGHQPPELESSSDSYTSTCTTTTTTSEEYQRMYAAQMMNQIQHAYEQSSSELDVDYEIVAMQQGHQEPSYLSSGECISGRRSVQECAGALVAPLSTYKLVDLVREVTPSPVPVTPSTLGSRHVVFLDEPEIKEVSITEDAAEPITHIQYDDTENQSTPAEEFQHQIAISETEQEDKLVIEDRSHILESQRIFQPTPEIKIEIPPVRHIPPTKIPNPVPKEWINPMVRALTTAPEVPFHMVECPCPKPCDCKCELEPQDINNQPDSQPLPQAQTSAPEPVSSTDLAPSPPHAEISQTEVFRESPPRGSFLTKAMSTAPDYSMQFVPPASATIPLPEDTKPYMPPPIDMKPYMREDYRPKSPFLSALTTAPEKPFEGHFDRDVPIHLIDLPTPKEHLTMSDALCIAPERVYTPLNPENATHMFEEQEKEKEKKKHQFQVLDHEAELGITVQSTELAEKAEYYVTEQRRHSQRKSSAFAAMQAFQPSREPLTPATPRNSIISLPKEESDVDYQKYCKAQERNQKRLDYFHKKEEEQQQQHTQTNSNQMSSSFSTTKQSSSSNSSSSTVQQMSTTTTATTTTSYASNLTQASKSSYSAAYGTASTTASKIDARELIEEVAEELEHSEVLFPPPSPLSHLKGRATSGLHKADAIPKYQRNWTVLPTQSPVRTPEPQELRENVPLAFLDAPKTPNAVVSSASNPIHRPVAQISTAAARGSITSTTSMCEQRQQQSSSLLTQKVQHQTHPTVPIIIEDRSCPVTMAFQSLDEHLHHDDAQTPSRPYTPSLTNKPAPIIPFYQTPEKLCFDECPATHARDYDRRSVSPFPDRARSPACGPPPNPLSAIRAPRLKENELAPMSPRVLQAGSITTGQSYLGAQHAQQQGQLIAHHESSSQSGMQSYSEKPESFEERQIGGLTIQKREKESHSAEQKQSQMQSQTTTQIGNTQIERRRKVTEEFEHTQSAKTIEIRTGSSATTERRQSYGKTGYVANQARRLSGLEQEISNLTSQSQAISARAAHMGDTSFPQLSSPTPSAKFPLKPTLPPHDEPAPPQYILCATTDKRLVDPPPGFKKQQQQQQQLSGLYGTSLVSSQQQQQKSLSAFSSNTTTTTSSSSLQANAVSCCLTKASATTTNNKACLANTASGVCPVTGTFCRPGQTCCKQYNNQINNNAYRPNASTGIPSTQPPTSQASAAAPSVSATASAPASSSAPSVGSNVSDKSNVAAGSLGSTGKGGAFGATSAPKRGRGTINKAVGPGVRVPLCNSCNMQIRGPFITALGRIWCPDHFICVNGNCRRPLQDIGFVEEKGDLYCEYCFEKYLAPTCSKCGGKIKGDCLNAIGKHFHPECFTCGHCGKLFGNTPFFLEDGNAYCEADWNELFTTKCFACGFPVEAGDRWVEALNHNYHSQCFNCTYCKQNLEGQSFYNKGGRPFCKNHAR